MGIEAYDVHMYVAEVSLWSGKLLPYDFTGLAGGTNRLTIEYLG